VPVCEVCSTLAWGCMINKVLWYLMLAHKNKTKNDCKQISKNWD
jgi:hypothetical protein